MAHPLRRTSLILALALLAPAAIFAADPDPAAGVGSITGRVLDANGNPVKGATVNAMELIPPPPKGTPAPDRNHKKIPKIYAAATTAQDGTYILQNVPAGVVRVAARLESSTDRRAHYAHNVIVLANKSVKATDIKLPNPGKPNNLP